MASVSVVIEESTFPCLNAIPKIFWGSFRGQREKSGDHFGVGILSGSGSFQCRDHFRGCTALRLSVTSYCLNHSKPTSVSRMLLFGNDFF